MRTNTNWGDKMTEDKISYLIGLKAAQVTFDDCGRPKPIAQTDATKLFEEARKKLLVHPQIKIVNELKSAYVLVAESTKEDFEQLYQVTVSKHQYVANAEVGRPIKINDWLMHGQPKIPSGLEDIVRYVELNTEVHIC